MFSFEIVLLALYMLAIPLKEKGMALEWVGGNK